MDPNTEKIDIIVTGEDDRQSEREVVPHEEAMLMFIWWNYCEQFLAGSLKTSRRGGDGWLRGEFCP